MPNKWIQYVLTSLIISVPCLVMADTKELSCMQRNNDGLKQVVNIVLDDASDKAEVEIHDASKGCNGSCQSDIYAKDVLPNSIRLILAQVVGPISQKIVIEVDRTNLHITTKNSLATASSGMEETFKGSCKLNVKETKKLL